ncbi:glycosyltransferase [Candidatus Palauibacter sp.]|uniref:glycosyltransferase n=1 Tax=Candidatus Palauibacter sp. TaxID=3101350 RepID=UPI003B01FD8E
MTLFLLAAVTLIVWVGIAGTVIYSELKVGRLDEVEPARADEPPPPRLSVIVAARNEERSVEGALRSLLDLRYPEFEVIFVNDRSEDRTGEIAERLAGEDARLSVLRVEELPDGWFGKNHAAQRGADAATGELLLFTDGDVRFAPDALALGVRHLIRERLDHLSAGPRIAVSGALLRASTMTLRLCMSATLRLWKVRDPRSSAFVGVGGYTLMRADAYRAIGGHRSVALRPDEDLRLGQLVKLSGLRSDFLNGHAMIACPWYDSLGGFVRGTEKNLFAARNYRLSEALVAGAGLSWLAVAPIVLAPLLWASGEIAPAAIFTASLLTSLLPGLTVLRDDSHPWWTGLLLPLGIVIVVYALMRSTIVGMVRGVAWGGPPVPLSELRDSGPSRKRAREGVGRSRLRDPPAT